MELAGQKLEKAEGHHEQKGTRKVRILVKTSVHTEGVQDREGLAPDLAGVDTELLEEGQLVVEGAGYGERATGGREYWGREGGGGRGGSDVE